MFSRFETKLEQYAGNLGRAAVELAKDWRTDKMLRQLEALLIVADAKSTLMLSGTGDVIDPDEGICAIGSGGSYALAAGREVVAVEPRVVMGGEHARILLPGEPGYEDAPATP